MTMIDFICWIQREREELRDELSSRFFDREEERIFLEGKLEQVEIILRKLTRSGVI